MSELYTFLFGALIGIVFTLLISAIAISFYKAEVK